MPTQQMRILRFGPAFLAILFLSGCQAFCRQAPPNLAPSCVPPEIPRELSKTVLPTYVIEPPDILVIGAVRVVPRSPYHLKTLDEIGIRAKAALPDAPIDGAYPIQLNGQVPLGFPYGDVKVSGLTLEEAEKAIETHLARHLKDPDVTVLLMKTAAQQEIAGEHLVGPDGNVTMGSYGTVSVVGRTISEAREQIEQHLSQFLESPEISLDVFAYNSKVYYVITQGAGLGDGVFRFPVTGNETVLDAIAQISGLKEVSSKRIWIARPTDQPGVAQRLPVSWDDITSAASTATNYQILPGDRIFIAEDQLKALDTGIAKVTAPFERIFGFSLLGVSTASRFSGNVLKGGGTQNQGGFGGGGY